MMKTSLGPFTCTECGKCCTYGPFMGTMSANEKDIRRWENAGRQDILDTAHIFSWGDNAPRNADLWMDPKTGDEISTGICPWVKKIDEDKWHCTIHNLRPNTCRNFPVSKEHRDQFECPGYWGNETES